MNDKSKSASNGTSISGVFYNCPVTIINKSEVIIYRPDHITKDNYEAEFKPICDKIASYLNDEGYINTSTPQVKIMKMKKI